MDIPWPARQYWSRIIILRRSVARDCDRDHLATATQSTVYRLQRNRDLTDTVCWLHLTSPYPLVIHALAVLSGSIARVEATLDDPETRVQSIARRFLIDL